MRRNTLETALGAVVLLVAGFFLWFAYRSADLAPTQGYTLNARFDRVTGLDTGADVRISGVKVGSVTEQRLDPQTFFALVTFSLDPSIRLPTDTSARIASESLLGGKYVSLEPGGADEELQEGALITYTQSSLDLESLLGQAVFGMGGGSGSGSSTETPAGGATLSPAQE